MRVGEGGGGASLALSAQIRCGECWRDSSYLNTVLLEALQRGGGGDGSTELEGRCGCVCVCVCLSLCVFAG